MAQTSETRILYTPMSVPHQRVNLMRSLAYSVSFLTVLQRRTPPLVRASGAITTERLKVIPPIYGLYPHIPECLITLFDLTYPGAERCLQRELDAWHGFAHVEELTAEASVLIIRPGAATELAA
jgi:hypothetical protein